MKNTRESRTIDLNLGKIKEIIEDPKRDDGRSLYHLTQENTFNGDDDSNSTHLIYERWIALDIDNGTAEWITEQENLINKKLAEHLKEFYIPMEWGHLYNNPERSQTCLIRYTDNYIHIQFIEHSL